MLERISIAGFSIEADRDATEAAYALLRDLWPQCCHCLYCRNYFSARHLLPRPFLDLCALLGIDPAKEAEVYELAGNSEVTRLYGGFYHLVGRMSGGAFAEDEGHTGRIEMHPLADGCEVGFTGAVSLVPRGFPQPILQMSFVLPVPWVLPERPTTPAP